MTASPLIATRSLNRQWILLGVVLMIVGLFGHLLAARAIGGYYMAYTHHIAGFLLITVVFGAVLAALGWRFWKGRHDLTILALGVIDAALGIVVYIDRFNIH